MGKLFHINHPVGQHVFRDAALQGGKHLPLCHPLLIGKTSVDFRIDEAACTVTAVCTAKVSGQTGVEMEALTGVSVALLTIYDMCKAIDKRMEIGGIHLCKKTGGKSGTFIGDAAYEDKP